MTREYYEEKAAEMEDKINSQRERIAELQCEVDDLKVLLADLRREIALLLKESNANRTDPTD